MEARVIWGFPRIRGTHFGSPNNKDYSSLGVYTGIPYLVSMGTEEEKQR